MDAIKRYVTNRDLYKLQYRALHAMLLTSALLSLLAAFINIGFSQPLPTIILPFTAASFCLLLFFYAQKGTHPYWAKLVFLLCLDFIYFPLDWITSSASINSMPYYSILFLLVTIILIEYTYEYIFPILFMALAVFLMYAQIRWPILVHTYNTSPLNPLTHAFHYLVIGTFILVIFGTVFRRYLKMEEVTNHHFVKDELTQLHGRSYAMNALQQTYNKAIEDQTPYTLALFRLGSLKAINQNQGADVGDHLIEAFAQILQSSLRTDDLCARLDGNLYMAILSQVTPAKADLLIGRLNKHYHDYQEKHITLETKLLVGTASFDYNSVSEVMRVAENKLDHSS